MSRWENWDESRVRVRPNKKGSRPRTKDTPDYENAELARVVQVDRGRYTVSMLEDARVVTAMRAKALRRSPVVPGDVVALVGDTSGAEGTLARLVRIEERKSLLRRSADDTDDAERVIVANADQLLIVVAAADPEPRTGFIDRALVAAYDAGISPILLITKADLVEDPRDPAGLISHYSELELTCVISSRSEDSTLSAQAVAQLRQLLAGKVTVLIGHSGVGKSTMVNALTGADRATGGVNAVTGRGRHTSSSAVALNLASADIASDAVPLDEETARSSWVIDTPGVRTFGLAHVEADDVLAAFEDLVEGSADCEPGCAHESPAGGCALDAWVAEGRAGEHGPARLASLRGLLASLAGAEEGPEEKTLGA
ncbi:ribosome small subunit-dependent GTPase A [Nesterenkonia flava]|uniref:Small ribosomal subunit biogenesis GTPase RsgA n=1 Tax=Nesterenkonia flava TaxID=469799 RepID=A0ABU1FSL2_9MICC|nr:GTPase RsgA [Nesterenkonia flava]MDR5711658.1 GTPase RsgA [Nesterenkonia flava]